MKMIICVILTPKWFFFWKLHNAGFFLILICIHDVSNSWNDRMKLGRVLQFQRETATIARATISAYFRNSDVRKSRAGGSTSCAERKTDSSRSVSRIQNGHPPFSRRDVRRSARTRVVTGALPARTSLPYILQLEQSSLSMCTDLPTLQNFNSISRRELITRIVAARSNRVGQRRMVFMVAPIGNLASIRVLGPLKAISTFFTSEGGQEMRWSWQLSDDSSPSLKFARFDRSVALLYLEFKPII